MKEPIRIFVGVDGPRAIAAEVLKYSVLRNTKREVHFYHLDDPELLSHFPDTINHERMKDLMYTGFSFYRWAIPLFCNFKGKAIYMDADIFNLHDIQDLWETPMNGHSHLVWKQFASVMLIDCEVAKWDFVSMCEQACRDEKAYKSMMWCRNGSCTEHNKGPLDPSWNHLDKYDKTTKMIHYTKVPTQPWSHLNHAHGHVYYELMDEALLYGSISHEDVQKGIDSGACHPQIYTKLKQKPPMPEHLGGNLDKVHIDKGALAYLQEKLGFKSILDVGCGPGWLKREGDFLWHGVDGDPTLDYGPGMFLHDFNKGRPWSIPLNRQYDLCWSVEFVEHVLPRHFDNWFHCFALCDTIFMTFSEDERPIKHVNVKPQKYWVDQMELRGYVLDQELTNGVRKVSTMQRDFVRKTGLVFRRRNHDNSNSR